jgi:hypothetical protein
VVVASKGSQDSAAVFYVIGKSTLSVLPYGEHASLRAMRIADELDARPILQFCRCDLFRVEQILMMMDNMRSPVAQENYQFVSGREGRWAARARQQTRRNMD